jgi:lipid II:glycine glycyltransferase (peptidoglycan interpeptide bridge formation enzyme)
MRASSVHIHAFGETSYHHGASADAYKKIPASYLLQWTAIRDALRRGDDVYNFWGIAPLVTAADGQQRAEKGHPFAGVTLFKTGFGGKLLELTQCVDIPLSLQYHGTRAFELLRKWRRGF